jgi:hypothetical protein
MNTLNRIKHAINKFNVDCNNQANLASPHARADLAEVIYDAILKQETTESSTVNDQRTFNFTNKTPDAPK